MMLTSIKKTLLVIFFFAFAWISGCFIPRAYAAPTWTLQNSGTTNNLYGVWALDPTHVWAVGQNGKIVFFNGTSWSSQTSGTAYQLTSVQGVDSTHVWAVGCQTLTNNVCSGNGIILFYNGTVWATKATITNTPLYTVNAQGIANVFAGGLSSTNTQYITRWGGSTWSARSISSKTNYPIFTIISPSSTITYAASNLRDMFVYNGSGFGKDGTSSTDVTPIYASDTFTSPNAYFDTADISVAKSFNYYRANNGGGGGILDSGESRVNMVIPGSGLSVTGSGSLFFAGAGSEGSDKSRISADLGNGMEYQMTILGSKTHFRAIDMLNDSEGYVVGDGGEIYAPTFVDDVTGPVLTLDAIPNTTFINAPAVFTGSVLDDESPVGMVQLHTYIPYAPLADEGSWRQDCTPLSGSYYIDASVTFRCDVDNSTTQAMGDGSYQVELDIRAVDSVGNKSSELGVPINLTFIVDHTPPVISNLATAKNPTKDALTSFTGTATDAWTKIASVDYQDGSSQGSWTSCSAQDSTFNSVQENFICNSLTLSPGVHTLYFRATDVAGNVLTEYSTSSVVVDITPPTNPSEFSILGVSTHAWSNIKPTFLWSPSSDNVAVFGYCVSLVEAPVGETPIATDPLSSSGLLTTNGVNSACPYATTATSLPTTSVALQTNKEYFFALKAVDTAGNTYVGAENTWSNVYSFKYDNQNPTGPSLVSAPTLFQLTKDITLCWGSDCGASAPADTGGSLLAGLQYKIGNSGVWYGTLHTGNQDSSDVIDPSITRYTFQEVPDYSNLIEGVNKVYVRAIDYANNTSVPIQVNIKINTNSPSSPQLGMVTATIPKNGDTADSDINSYAFSWLPPESYTGQASRITYCYSINQLPTAVTCNYTASGVTQLPADAYATMPGTNNMFLVARDESGNINYETYTLVTFTFSGSAPGIPRNISVADTSIKATPLWRLNVSWETPLDVGSSISKYRVYRSTNNIPWNESFTLIGSTSGTSYSDANLSQQTYYYCVKACDVANNCSAATQLASGYPTGKFLTPATLVSDPKVSDVTTRKATIKWVTNRNSDSVISYGTKSKKYKNEDESKSDQTDEHEIKLRNLEAGKKYYFVAKWTDEDGNTGVSDEKTFETDPEPTVKDVSVTNINIDSARIQFTVKGATKVKLYYGPSSAFGDIADLNVGVNEVTSNIFLSSLQDGVKYFFRLTTFDSENAEYNGTTLDFTTLARPKITLPKVYTVKGTSSAAVYLTWLSNTDISSIVSYYPVGDPSLALDSIDQALVKGEHTMLIQNLVPERVYTLLLKGKDVVGNEATVQTLTFTTPLDTRAPKLQNITVASKVSLVEGVPNAQIILTWDTDEFATSQVWYGPGALGEYAKKTAEDANLVPNHHVIVPDLVPGAVYHLKIVSKDRAGNSSESDNLLTITPKAPEDALTIVTNGLRELVR